MVITWYGENCFKIQSGETSLITDPFSSDIGLSAPRSKTDVVLKTFSPFPLVESDKEGFVIASPGEYDIKNVFIAGTGLAKESTSSFIKTIYIVRMEGISLGFLGYVSENLDSNVLEKLDLGNIDILFFPVGQNKESPFLEPKAVMGIIKNLEPKIAIPSLYATAGLKRKAVSLKEFTEATVGKKENEFEMVEKLSIKKKDLAEIKNTKFVAFKI